ncbi:thiazole biosynthesis adenylyltransferase ThiF [Brevibacillus fluminis]|uniref:Thiazole biosynthesis adenylyltransferase ThiF n=1 Tax=Brevibacillus fluminis TaxID=511487 RepID=A0A3M8DGD6_9BACL|nr:thiazole biosynthesis adenylyltransferase ThiF [Brevibacillus fluminis]RNB87104.1 thiazole biosynthesis adenylyltransferase ThiF [Brevibacillus fluminis]
MTGRYSRQELFTPIGTAGQSLLGQKHVLIIGAGALGTGSAESLVRAGVGTLTIVDRDYVEWSNLQRQQLYSEDDAAKRLPKAVAAQKRLNQLNSDVRVNALVMDVTTAEIHTLLAGVDLIVDATDNFDTRMLLNDAAQKYGKPWIYGACVGSYGITFTIVPGRTPCLGCLMEQVPLNGPTCDTAGIIAPAVQMVVAYQVAEALKILVGDHHSLHGKLISFNLWTNEYAGLHVNALKREDCPSCGQNASYPYLQQTNQPQTTILCGRDTVQIRPRAVGVRDLAQIAQQLSHQGIEVRANPYLLSCTIGENRIVLFQDGRALVHGTHDKSEAKSLYHRFFG